MTPAPSPPRGPRSAQTAYQGPYVVLTLDEAIAVADFIHGKPMEGEHVKAILKKVRRTRGLDLMRSPHQ